MPLSCKHGEKTVFPFDFDAAGWAGLKASNASEKNLRMTCCDEHATIKTSKLGTQFFAHKRRGECTSAAETAEHLFVKACIAKAIRGTGWEVNTEQRGQAPDGSVWVADVMASRGAHRIPDDLPERGRQYDAQRLGGVAVELISHLPIERQARVIGATWLDQQLIGGGSGLGNLGFGGEAKQAMLQRADFLAEQGLAERRGQRVFLARNLLTVMRNREVAQAGKDIAAETGLEHRPAADGQRVAGIYRRSVMLASGRYAMLDDGMGFSLVPWKPVIEQRLGQQIAATVRGGGVSWEIGRRPGLSRG